MFNISQKKTGKQFELTRQRIVETKEDLVKTKEHSLETKNDLRKPRNDLKNVFKKQKNDQLAKTQKCEYDENKTRNRFIIISYY